MRRRILTAGALVLVVGVLFAISTADRAAAQPGQARIRFIHAAPDTNRVRFLVDGRLMSNVSFGFDSSKASEQFMAIAVGDRQIEVQSDDSARETLLRETIHFTDGDLVTLALVGHSKGEGIRQRSIVRINEPRVVTNNKAAVTFVHLMMPDINAKEDDRFPLEVWNVDARGIRRTDLQDTAVRELRYGEVTEPEYRDPGIASFTITLPGSQTPLLPASAPLRLQLAPNRLYTIFILGYDGRDRARAPSLFPPSYRLDANLRPVNDSASAQTAQANPQNTPTVRAGNGNGSGGGSGGGGTGGGGGSGGGGGGGGGSVVPTTQPQPQPTATKKSQNTPKPTDPPPAVTNTPPGNSGGGGGGGGNGVGGGVGGGADKPTKTPKP